MVLGLSVCWVDERLRFWDRIHQRYLPDQRELTHAVNSERQARADAEARIRQLEEELRRQESP